MKQPQFSLLLCVAAFALSLAGCGGDGGSTPAATNAAGVSGGAAGIPSATAGTGAAGSSVAGSAAAGTSGAPGMGAAGTGTAAAGTGAAGSGMDAAGMNEAGMDATAGTGAAAGSGGIMAAAGAGAAAGTGGAAGGMLGGPLKYTSAFTMGMTVPTTNKCPMSAIGGGTGDNKSPALSWTGGPMTTKSFAIVLYDTKYNLLHWVLWDIPATVNMLPEGLAAGYALTTPAGAHQVASMGTNPHAYYGPCSSGASAGTYEYRLYALNVDKLALMESSTGAQAQAAVEAAKLESVIFSAKPM